MHVKLWNEVMLCCLTGVIMNYAILRSSALIIVDYYRKLQGNLIIMKTFIVTITSSNWVNIKYKTDLHSAHFKFVNWNSVSLIFIPECNLCMLNKKKIMI